MVVNGQSIQESATRELIVVTRVKPGQLWIDIAYPNELVFIVEMIALYAHTECRVIIFSDFAEPHTCTDNVPECVKAFPGGWKLVVS